MSKCKYCGVKASAGQPCGKSPIKTHVVNNGPKKCLYCGVTATVGQPCRRSPTKYHVNGD